jgi:hypothetical protein
MRKKILIPVFFCLWTAAIYFFSDIPFAYFGYALRIQNNFLDYLQEHNLITAIVIAAIVTVITVYKKWSDNKQFFFIKTLFCYYLGFSLLTYGLTKIFQTQFVLLPFAAWQLPLEKASGSNLAWAFLGRAPWFQVLLGFLEFIPAILILFRRTALLGAILLLPMTLNVFLINYALDLWEGTKELSLDFLAVNVIILAFEWKKIWHILSIIIDKGTKLKWFRWEAAIMMIAVVVFLYPFTKIILDYRSQKNSLMGDWFNGHPVEWSLQTERINDSLLKQRTLKFYFEPYGMYSEINDAGFLMGDGRHYDLDEKNHSLAIFRPNDSVEHFTYSLINDSTLQTKKIVDSIGNIKLIQVYKKHIVRGKQGS